MPNVVVSWKRAKRQKKYPPYARIHREHYTSLCLLDPESPNFERMSQEDADKLEVETSKCGYCYGKRWASLRYREATGEYHVPGTR